MQLLDYQQCRKIESLIVDCITGSVHTSCKWIYLRWQWNGIRLFFSFSIRAQKLVRKLGVEQNLPEKNKDNEDIIENPQVKILEFYSEVKEKMAQMYEAENFGPVELPNNENLEDLDILILFQYQKSIKYKR